jgi:hypothetical protein
MKWRRRKMMRRLLGDRGRDFVSVESHQAIQGSMEKLQNHFLEVMQEKVELKKHVEELKHQCVLLRGDRHDWRLPCPVSHAEGSAEKSIWEKQGRLAQDMEDMKVKLVEL